MAANIEVEAAQQSNLLPDDATRLSDLATGITAEVLALGPRCQGFSRRRLMDLGLTPGARVEAALDNTFGDPRAFRVRGTTVALRRRQTDDIWIREHPAPRPEGART